MQYNPIMQIGIAQIVGGLVVVALLIGGAFSMGAKWNVEADGAEAAAAASALDSAATSDEIIKEGNAESGLYSVIKVVDGDTIAILMNGKSETLRLIGIDTPETVDTRVEVQCFGKESSEKMISLLGGKKVRLEIDPKEGERDKYKRLLAYVFREDGLFVNKYMIEEGYAYEYTYDTTYKYQKEFKAAEVKAKDSEKGLWAPNVCPLTSVPTVKGNSTSPSEQKQEAPPVMPPIPTPQPTMQAQPQTEPPQQKTEPPPASPPPQSTSSYTCSSNKYNCTDFKTHAEAQAVFEQCGGAANDVHKLDNNKDGEACESLP
jgi:micrococcal nuclease